MGLTNWTKEKFDGIDDWGKLRDFVQDEEADCGFDLTYVFDEQDVADLVESNAEFLNWHIIHQTTIGLQDGQTGWFFMNDDYTLTPLTLTDFARAKRNALESLHARGDRLEGEKPFAYSVRNMSDEEFTSLLGGSGAEL